MTFFDEFNSKFSEEWSALAKQAAKMGETTAREAAGAGADVLKNLAKELGTLGDRLEKWVGQAAAKPETSTGAKMDGDPPSDA